MKKNLVNLKSSSGMTLVEILVSIIILGLIMISIFPLITQSLQAVNLSNVVSKQLFDTQDSFEVVSVTKDGAMLDDGTFIPTSSFAVFGNNTTWVTGMTIEKKKLVRFLASRLGSQTYRYDLNEGYSAEEGTYTITDNSIKKGDSYSVSITGKYNDSYTVASQNHDDGYLVFTLASTGANRLTNYASPYLITVTNTTANEVRVNASLSVHLPMTVIADDSQGNGNLMIASSSEIFQWTHGSNWININKNLNKINKIINIHNIEDSDKDCIVAIADKGSIYLWKDGSNGFEAASLPQNIKTALGSSNLNDIILVDKSVMIVGNGGIVLKGIYQFTENDITWNWSVVRPSGTDWEHSNLNAITYNDDDQEYYLAGDNKLMLKYKNNFEVLTSNNPALKNISGKNAVYFTPDGDYLKTAGAPVSGNSSRTVFMVVRPEASVANISLLTMASSAASTGYLSLRTDANGNLAVQNSSGMVTSTNLKLSPDGNYIISCRYDKDASKNNVILSLNGATFTGTLTGSLNTDGPIQLGSDSLTSVTGTSDFTGYIGDVFVFNGALRNERFIKQTGTIIKIDWDCAPEMDIVKRYLSVKYDLSISLANNYYWLNRGINSNNPKLNDLHWKNNGWGDQNYWNGNNDLWPYKTSGTDPYSFPTAIWLDAFQLSGERINTWTPRIGGTAFNFTVPIPKSLNAIAFNQSSVIAGGDKQNLFQYDTDNQILNQTDSFNVSKYSISDMLLADNEVVALLNNYNNISTQNYIARIAESGNNALLSSVMSHQLNSIYSYNEAALLLVTGNNGTILCSQDKGVTWSSINSGTTRNLSTGCIR